MPTRKITTDLTAMLEALSESLYDDPMIAVRELVCNALDALQRSSRKDGFVQLNIGDDGYLEIDDNGCGIASHEVEKVLGTAFYSGTREATQDLDNVTPIGRFGIGLLSARAISTRVEIESRVDGESEGLVWQWNGGETYTWSAVPRLRSVGTIVRLWPHPELHGELLDPLRLTDFVRRHLTYVAARVQIGTLRAQLNEHAPPWRWNLSRTREKVLKWLASTNVAGCIHVWTGSTQRFTGGGMVVCFPEVDNQWFNDISIYRSGVLVPFIPGSLHDSAFSWLKLIVDAPGVGVTLDRSSLDAQGVKTLRQEIIGLTRQAVCNFIMWAAGDHNFPVSWWKHHRASLLAAIAELIKAKYPIPFAELNRWIPFNSENGWLTFDEIVAESGRTQRSISGALANVNGAPVSERVFVVRWVSTHERIVFNALADADNVTLVRPFDVTKKYRMGNSIVSTDTRVRILVDRIGRALARFNIDVAVTESGGRRREVATWSEHPPWASPRTFRPKKVRRHPPKPELHICADSDIVRALARNIDEIPIRAAAWLLTEWATECELRVRECIGQALCRLTGSLVAPPAVVRRCFIAYDWTRNRTGFDAVRRGIEHFNLVAIDPSHETQGRFVLNNILRVMRSCHLFITVLTPAREDSTSAVFAGERATPLNANLLLEAGIAAAFTDRPHIICHHEKLILPSDLDGFLTLRYKDLNELEHSLKVEVRKVL